MPEVDVRLQFIALSGIGLLAGLIVSRIRLHPLIALLVVSLTIGLLSGVDVKEIVGGTFEGVIVALGAMPGKTLAASGVTGTIAEAVVTR